MDRFSRFIKSMDDSVRQVSTVGEQNIKRRRGRKYNRILCCLWLETAANVVRSVGSPQVAIKHLCQKCRVTIGCNQTPLSEVSGHHRLQSNSFVRSVGSPQVAIKLLCQKCRVTTGCNQTPLLEVSGHHRLQSNSFVKSVGSPQVAIRHFCQKCRVTTGCNQVN